MDRFIGSYLYKVWQLMKQTSTVLEYEPISNGSGSLASNNVSGSGVPN